MLTASVQTQPSLVSEQVQQIDQTLIRTPRQDNEVPQILLEALTAHPGLDEISVKGYGFTDKLVRGTEG